MTDVAIRVENLSKLYHIGRARQRHDTLRDALSAAFRRPASRAARREDETLWALRDVSFEVQRGEVVGIIGRNGAGKSTLLKILSRITEPTSGRAEIHGRVGSLLEVGTGFHPELTGRENIYLNGAILGMHRTEIDRKFDEIVAFAEIEKFLDTPVKHYSSGMYVRLAFAVAAHLDPEILLVDEVLAVGDAAFQKKCLGKMDSVGKEGRTVLFVSHNMGSVQSLCRRGILVKDGAIALDDRVDVTIASYLGQMETRSSQSLSDRTDRSGRGQAKLVTAAIRPDSANAGAIAVGSPVRFVFQTDKLMTGMALYFTIYDSQGCQIANFNSAVHGSGDTRDPTLEGTFVCSVEELMLAPGRYRLNAALLTDGEIQDHIEAAAVFDVEPGIVRGRSVNRRIGHGGVYLPHRWLLPC